MGNPRDLKDMTDDDSEEFDLMAISIIRVHLVENVLSLLWIVTL